MKPPVLATLCICALSLPNVAMTQRSGLALTQRSGLAFDGVDDLAILGKVPAQGKHTYEVIARFPSVQSSTAWIKPIVCQFRANGICNHGSELSANPGSTAVWFNVDIPGCRNWSGIASPELGTVWHHLAATYDGATQRLYVDGVLVASKANTRPTAHGGLSLGATVDNVHHCKVEIAEVRLWNHARTRAQIRASLAEGSVSGSASGLVALYLLITGSGQKAFDSSPNGYHLQLGNSDKADSADPKWITPCGANAFGKGCAGSGKCEPSIGIQGSPCCGGTGFTITLGNALAPSSALLVFGFTQSPNCSLPLPYSLGGGCSLLVCPDIILGGIAVPGSGACSGKAQYRVKLPAKCPAGATFSLQWGVLDRQAPGLGIAVSRALNIRI